MKEAATSSPPIDESAAVVLPSIIPNQPNVVDQQQNVVQLDPCNTWQDNPLFRDNHIFHYQVQLEIQAYDIDNEDFICNDSGECSKDVTFDLDCSVVRIGQHRGYCASKLECKANPRKYQKEIPTLLNSYWFRDSNGFYMINTDRFQISEIINKSGDCKNTKYIDCKPGTLAHDFDFFSQLIPTIPTLKSGNVIETDYDEDLGTTSSWEVIFKNNSWCSEFIMSGPDSTQIQICLSDTFGIVSLKESFSGGINRDLTVRFK